MTGLSALGPWPGRSVHKVQQLALDLMAESPSGVRGLPPLVQMPRRGPWAGTVARTCALLPELPVEIGPHGWKLADRPGADLAQAQALLREDVETLAAVADGYTGPVVLTARGPWTLAATVYLARGDRVLSDHGAVRDVTDSLAQGLVELLATLRAAVPGVVPVVVLREPDLPDVLGGTVATFSGHSRLPAVPGEIAAATLARLVGQVRAAGVGEVVLHGGVRVASRALDVMAASGADAVGLALGGLRGPQWERVAGLVERGTGLWFGLPRDVPRKGGSDPRRSADLLSKPWRAVGLAASGLADVVVHTDTSGAGDGVLGNLQLLQHEIRAAEAVAALLAERAAQ